MNHYVVALFSQFTNEIEMQEVYAYSKKDAAITVLRFEGFENLENRSYEELQEFAYDADHMIEVYELGSKSKMFKINKPRPYAKYGAEVDYNSYQAAGNN